MGGPTAAPAAAPLPRQRPQRPWLLFLGSAGVPFLLFTIYVYGMSVDRFRTTARLAVHSTQAQPMPTGLSILDGLGIGSGQADIEQLAAYLRSSDLADLLDHDLALRRHFSDPAIDWWNRLPTDALREDFLDEYARRLQVTVDPLSHTVLMEFQSYDAAYGVQVVARMVAAAEDFQNRTTQNLAQRRLAFLSGQLAESAERLATSRRSTLAFQSQHGLADPQSMGAATVGRITAIEAQLSEARTALRALRSYLSAEAAEVQAAQARIDALAAQLGEEKALAVGGGDEALAPLLSRYADLLIAQEFALETYRTLLVATEQTRVEAQQAATALVQIEHPVTGERPAYPRRLYLLASAAAILLALWLVIRVLLATVREHQDS